MQLMRIGNAGRERPAVRDEQGRYFDVSPLTSDIDGAFLAAAGVARVRAALAGGELPEIELWDSRIGSPIARPMAVLCIGQNYAAHAAESGAAPPERPILFFKHPNTVVGPYDDVTVPRGSSRTDWEVELGIVIGRRACYLTSTEEALKHVAGLVMEAAQTS